MKRLRFYIPTFLILSVTLTFIWNPVCLAQEKDVALFIWLEDTAFNDEGLRIAESQIEATGLPVRILRTSAKRFDHDLSSLSDLFESREEKVGVLMLGTHGTTNTRENQTLLLGMGGFGEQGSFKGLRSLFELLHKEQRLSAELHIYLNACSTMCGTSAAATLRTQGLFQELQAYGIQRTSLWGARQSMIRQDLREHPTFPRILARLQKEKLPILKLLGAAFGPPLVLVSGSYLFYEGFTQEALARVGRAGLLSLYPLGVGYAYASLIDGVSYLMMRPWNKAYALRGFLIESDGDRVSIQSIENGKLSGLVGSRRSKACGAALVSSAQSSTTAN